MSPGNTTKREIRVRTIEILISGHVQKIGFRSCVKRIAINLGIEGEVMNLGGGKVLIHATAEPFILEKLVSMLYGCPRSVIRDLHIRDIERRDFDSFSIKRGSFQ
jgi:acylphosphatase